MSREVTQIIDGKENFQPFEEFLKKRDVWKSECDYSVISIFGAQSTGKSTLLNKLFGTGFQEMDKNKGFHQCTQGIFLSLNEEMGNIIVLDVEGTDSMERQNGGTEGTTFEKRISLFALAVSDVLLINIMERNINRAQASNYMLLQLLFELNLQIFHKDRAEGGKAAKTLLYFVVRDYSGDIKEEHCTQTILKNLNRMWEDLWKEQKVKIELKDCFEVAFTYLPHKTLEAEKWEKKVEDMKPKFNATKQETVIKKEFSRKIPITGLQEYTKNTWKIIKENKDIDLPAQREMMARYRCGEITAQILKEFEKVENKLEEKYISEQGGKKKETSKEKEFGREAEKEIEKAIESFKAATGFYLEKTRTQYEQELRKKMTERVKILFSKIVKQIREKCFASLKETIAKKTEGEAIWEDCLEALKSLKEKVREEIIKNAEEAAKPFEGWIEKEEIEEYEKMFEDERQRVIETQVRLRVERKFDQMSSAFGEEIRELIKPKSHVGTDPDEDYKDFVANIQLSYKTTVEATCCQIQDIYDEFNVTASPEDTETRVETQTRKIMVEVFKSFATYLANSMVKQFKEKFPPIMPTTTEKIMETYERARENSVKLLNLYFYVPLGPKASLPQLEYDFKSKRPKVIYPQLPDENLMVLTASETKNVMTDFCSEILVIRIHAEHENERKNAVTNSVPWYFWILLVVLGWNEIMWVLRNPFYLLLGLILIGLVFGVKLRTMFLTHLDSMPFFVKSIVMAGNDYLPPSYQLIETQKKVSQEKKNQ